MSAYEGSRKFIEHPILEFVSAASGCLCSSMTASLNRFWLDIPPSQGCGVWHDPASDAAPNQDLGISRPSLAVPSYLELSRSHAFLSVLAALISLQKPSSFLLPKRKSRSSFRGWVASQMKLTISAWSTSWPTVLNLGVTPPNARQR